jgi:hypothetical protein
MNSQNSVAVRKIVHSNDRQASRRVECESAARAGRDALEIVAIGCVQNGLSLRKTIFQIVRLAAR